MAGRRHTEARMQREGMLAQLRTLLEDVPGAETPWHEIEASIYHAPFRILTALVYRVRMARKQSYDEGVLHGKAAS